MVLGRPSVLCLPTRKGAGEAGTGTGRSSPSRREGLSCLSSVETPRQRAHRSTAGDGVPGYCVQCALLKRKLLRLYL